MTKPLICARVIERIQRLFPEKVAEVEDFVDFLMLRDEPARSTLEEAARFLEALEGEGEPGASNPL